MKIIKTDLFDTADIVTIDEVSKAIVIYNNLPGSYKYLVKEIDSGDYIYLNDLSLSAEKIIPIPKSYSEEPIREHLWLNTINEIFSVGDIIVEETGHDSRHGPSTTSIGEFMGIDRLGFLKYKRGILIGSYSIVNNINKFALYSTLRLATIGEKRLFNILLEKGD